MSGASSHHPRNTGPMQAARRCGARTRAGTPCQAPAIAGAQRCRMHGGRGSGAPGGNRNALVHGAYGQVLRERSVRYRALQQQIRTLLEVLDDAVE